MIFTLLTNINNSIDIKQKSPRVNTLGDYILYVIKIIPQLQLILNSLSKESNVAYKL